MSFDLNLSRVGCGEKIAFESLQSVAKSLNVPFNTDTAKLEFSNSILLSTVDKVGRFCDDISLYARMTVRHIVGDIIASNGSPLQMSFCIEAGPEIDDVEKLQKLTGAILEYLHERQISVGNIHSIRSDYTSITGFAIGVAKPNHIADPTQGGIFLSDRIGYFKMLVVQELDKLVDGSHSELERLFVDELLPCLSGCTDVSGFGLAGALVSLSNRHSLRMEVDVGRETALHPDVFAIPISCIDTKASNVVFDCAETSVTRMICSCAELAGPMLMLCNGDSESDFYKLFSSIYGQEPIKIGRYRASSQPNVEIKSS